jgi:hypothetical protein
MRPYAETLIKYLVISIVSLAVAVALFYVGGSFAEVIGSDDRILQLSFKAGGALAGFIIIFMLSLRVIVILDKKHRAFSISRIFLNGAPRKPMGNDDKCLCKLRLLNSQTGVDREVELKYGWEAGYFTVYPKPNVIGPDDIYSVKLELGDKALQSEFYSAYTPIISMGS